MLISHRQKDIVNAVSDGDLKTLKSLKLTPEDTLFVNKTGINLLCFAAGAPKNAVVMCRRLRQLGSSPGGGNHLVKMSGGKTFKIPNWKPIHYAADNSTAPHEFIKILFDKTIFQPWMLDHGQYEAADASVETPKGETALHLACYQKDPSILMIQELVYAGVPMNVIDARGMTAYDYLKADHIKKVYKELQYGGQIDFDDMKKLAKRDLVKSMSGDN